MDRYVWYAIVGIIIMLLIIAYGAGWFEGAPAPAPKL